LTVHDKSTPNNFLPSDTHQKFFEAAKGFAVIDEVVQWRPSESVIAGARTVIGKRRKFLTVQNATSSGSFAAEN
jgi:hypothetical protein